MIFMCTGRRLSGNGGEGGGGGGGARARARTHTHTKYEKKPRPKTHTHTHTHTQKKYTNEEKKKKPNKNPSTDEGGGGRRELTEGRGGQEQDQTRPDETRGTKTVSSPSTTRHLAARLAVPLVAWRPPQHATTHLGDLSAHTELWVLPCRRAWTPGQPVLRSDPAAPGVWQGQP